jgi:endo-1,3-1,4-beta-glycanase ExoK
MRSTDFKKYGYFGARMKPSNAPGTVSSLFTYTGSSDGNAHNEIDIEFLGKDTSKVQFNIYCNSDEANKRAYLYSLGFDASKEYHDYGFYWGEDRITWYVDGIAVYSNSDSKLGLPATAQRVFLNHWNVASSLYSWAGTWSDANLPSKDYYKWVSYKAL